MRHKKFESLIVLNFYGENLPEDKKNLDSHLLACPKCKKFQQDIIKAIPRRRPAEDLNLDGTLLEARNEFHQKLFEGKGHAVPAYKILRHEKERGFVTVPIYAVAAIAFVMLAIGMMTSYLFINGSGKNNGSIISELVSQNRSKVAIDNIRFLSTDPKSGEIQFSFDFIKRYDVKGSLDDRDIQKILAYALGNSDNPGVRLKTVGMLDEAAQTKPDQEIENALVKAAKADDNAGVRRQALLSLKKLPFDNDVKDVLLFVLQNDKNPGMRVAAINCLSEKELASGSTLLNTKVVDPKILNVLKEKSESDQNQYVRLKAADMLKGVREL